MGTIKFTKMHGAGNDYIYVDAIHQEVPCPERLAVDWSAWHTGIGADGLIMICPSDKADFRMRMFNNDGSEGIMCGNGIRCVGKFVYDKRLTASRRITVETLGGIKTLDLKTDGRDMVVEATVDMGAPRLCQPAQMATADGGMKQGVVEANGREYIGTFVSMGNPHFVIAVDDIAAIDLEHEGVALEHHPMFPQRCNIEFAQVLPGNEIRTRVWERGTGITLACGTGACATAVACALNGFTDRKAVVVMDGGRISIEWRESDGHIIMTGPATTVFEGEIEL